MILALLFEPHSTFTKHLLSVRHKAPHSGDTGKPRTHLSTRASSQQDIMGKPLARRVWQNHENKQIGAEPGETEGRRSQNPWQCLFETPGHTYPNLTTGQQYKHPLCHEPCGERPVYVSQILSASGLARSREALKREPGQVYRARWGWQQRD